ncbi:SNF1-related protein kinase regulatory subunit gamma-1 [Gossypium arboreum]|uniref:SNF1-related protein kinase regulatory subunit gamma-1 n=1 Tax=Gossypium arboreum TaxID=29729 RepID=A0A0B0N134_GOSAR|nr:SNF1-related protein kinase regulatory subunit gamma-1 [Gossypium arboreum]
MAMAMASVQLERQTSIQDSPRSPEAKLGMQVEDLWDVQEPELSPNEKLNACFESIPVSAFPISPQGIEIKSDASLAEAVQILAQNKILSAPVVDVDAPEDATWMDRYIGIVEFAGIAVWILQQSEPSSPRSPSSPNGAEFAITANGMVSAAGLGALGPEDASITSGDFFEALTSSEFYKNTKVVLLISISENLYGHLEFCLFLSCAYYSCFTCENIQVRDISGSFRWAPFLALQKSNTFLTMLLLLSKYKMKSVPVLDLGDGKIDNIITQSAVIHMLAECTGLHWFESWGSKKLSEIGLPTMSPEHIITDAALCGALCNLTTENFVSVSASFGQSPVVRPCAVGFYEVYEDEPVLQAFKLMRKKRIGGIPVIECGGKKAIGNISLRDVQFLLTAPDIYRDYRSITAKNFLIVVRNYLEKHEKRSPMLSGMITCKRDETVKELIQKLDSEKIQRVYVTDEDGNLEGVITLRDIISRLVHEPRGYFGDFFDGVLPLPENSRV